MELAYHSIKMLILCSGRALRFGHCIKKGPNNNMSKWEGMDISTSQKTKERTVF